MKEKFFSVPMKNFCPLVLGDIVRLIDKNDEIPPIYYDDHGFVHPMSIPEMIARHIDKSVQALDRLSLFNILPDSEKLKYYPSISNYMVGVLDALVFLGFITENHATIIMEYMGNDFMKYLIDGKYYSVYPSKFLPFVNL